MQYWNMAESLDVVDAFFPDVSLGQLPRNRSVLLTALPWEQQDAFKAILEGSLAVVHVLLVDAGDGVSRMLSSWPWPVPVSVQLPFSGIAMSTTLLPSTIHAPALCLCHASNAHGLATCCCSTTPSQQPCVQTA
jgi:hypothetical protein